jgi:hypothetical protein
MMEGTALCHIPAGTLFLLDDAPPRLPRVHVFLDKVAQFPPPPPVRHILLH